MSKIITSATMSLDGYIAGPEESGFDLLFRWYFDGDVEVPTGNPDMTFRTSPASAAYFKEMTGRLGALVVGRRLYDLTDAWGGRHPLDVPTVVLTHRPPEDRPREDENFVFVTDGIEAAVEAAKRIAGGKDVAVNGGTIARQALEAGLLDEVAIDLAPVLLGDGVPFFGSLPSAPYVLEGPISVIEGVGVTHLRYRVVRSS